MFEVFATDWRAAEPWRRRDTLVLSVGLHAVVVLGAASIPARSGGVVPGSPGVETVTFVEILRDLERPAPAAAPQAVAPAPGRDSELEAAAAVALLSLGDPEPAAPGVPIQLPDRVPATLVAGSFLPVGSGSGRPAPLATGSRGGARGGEAVELARVAELPVLRNRSEMDRAWKRLYPRALHRRRIQGESLVSFVIDTDGRVDPLTIRLLSASHPEFGDATLEGVRRLRFRPARVGGRPVRVRAQLPVSWRLGAPA